ncbi:hypothetical protein [Roseivivax lentus]|nr:hypothetical protein [Roseivivax lentus]
MAVSVLMSVPAAAAGADVTPPVGKEGTMPEHSVSAPSVELAAPASEGDVIVEVLTGRLMPSAALVLRSETGEIAGSVAQFGLGANAPRVLSQLVVIDRAMVSDGKLRLTVWIQTETGERPATDEEFLGLRLAR